MAHHGIDEQARFRQGKRWDICEFAKLKLLGSFFVACGFFAGTSCYMISHCANHAPKKRHKFPRCGRCGLNSTLWNAIACKEYFENR